MSGVPSSSWMLGRGGLQGSRGWSRFYQARGDLENRWSINASLDHAEPVVVGVADPDVAVGPDGDAVGPVQPGPRPLAAVAVSARLVPSRPACE